MKGRREIEAPRAYVEELQRSARVERIKARAPRYLLIAVLVILCMAGLKSIVEGPQKASADSADSALVDQGAEDLALRFARTYLTYDPNHTGARQRELVAMMPTDLDPSAALTSNTAQQVEWLQIAQHQEALAGGVVIVVEAQVAGEAAPSYLAVPVLRRSNGALSITAYPSLVGAPTVSNAAAVSREEVSDEGVTDTVGRVISNYLRGQADNVSADLAPDATYSSPAQKLRLTSVDDVVWAAPDTAAVLITVEATDTAHRVWTLTYEVGIDQSGGRTTVTYIETVPNAT